MNTRYAYLLIIKNKKLTRQQVQDFIDTRSEILNWFAYFPNAIFIVSEKTASQLTDVMRVLTKDEEHFFIIDVKSDRNGWMSKKAWDFISNPKSVNET